MKILEVMTSKRKLGNLGEEAALAHLKKNKYVILEKNYVALGNEIDIIAKNEDTLAFVEVKTRSLGNDARFESRPSASVTPEKQRKIIKTARYYAASHPLGLRLRLDVIEVYVKDNKVERIHHIENAFNQNTANKFHR